VPQFPIVGDATATNCSWPEQSFWKHCLGVFFYGRSRRSLTSVISKWHIRAQSVLHFKLDISHGTSGLRASCTSSLTSVMAHPGSERPALQAWHQSSVNGTSGLRASCTSSLTSVISKWHIRAQSVLHFKLNISHQ